MQYVNKLKYNLECLNETHGEINDLIFDHLLIRYSIILSTIRHQKILFLAFVRKILPKPVD